MPICSPLSVISVAPPASLGRIATLRLLLFVCCISCIHAAQAAPLKVALVFSGEYEVYQVFESVLRNSLESSQEIRIMPSADVARAELIVAIGGSAASRFRNSSIPVLNVMVSRAELDKIERDRRRTASGIYMDQPTERQFSLLRAALPHARSIGVLISNETPELVLLRQLSSTMGFVLHVQKVRTPEQLASRLSRVLNDSDVLLVLPDTEVYRSDTIRNILLETYRRHVPMIGLSQNYVRAGALSAVYSTPVQMANQAAQIVGQYAKTKKLPDYQYPLEFEVAVNRQVALSLGLTIKNAEQLRTEIGARP